MKVVFHHIPKTAGNSVLHVLERNYPDGQLLKIYRDRDGQGAPEPKPDAYARYFAEIPGEDWARIRCISGHEVQWGLTALEEPFRVFTLIRDPVERVLSEHHYLRGREEYNIGGKAGRIVRENGWTVSDVYRHVLAAVAAGDERLLRGFAAYFNGQTRAILATQRGTLPVGDVSPGVTHRVREVLEQVLAERYVLGATSEYDRSMDRFAREFGWTGFELVRVNETPDRPSPEDVPEEEIELIRRYNTLDDELYARALAEVRGHDAPVPAPAPAVVVPASNGDVPDEPGPYDFFVPTALPAEELREKLRLWAPWRYEVIFGNGVRTSEFAKAPFFTPDPANKWHLFKDHIPEEALRGGRALDVGSNIGHYSIFLRSKLDMSVTGVEGAPRNLEIARYLLDLTGLDRIEYVEADASKWCEQDGFDLVLHLGTLDHLRHPFLALENAHAMLKPDGYLALETTTLANDDDPFACRFVGERDQKIWLCWLLGRGALLEMLEEAGFDRIEVLLDWRNPDVMGADDMARLALLARKASA